jgi:hypothetical protein
MTAASLKEKIEIWNRFSIEDVLLLFSGYENCFNLKEIFGIC